MSEEIKKPVCASTGPEGCVKCAFNYSCHDQRLGRMHVPWPMVALLFLAAIGLIGQISS